MAEGSVKRGLAGFVSLADGCQAKRIDVNGVLIMYRRLAIADALLASTKVLTDG